MLNMYLSQMLGTIALVILICSIQSNKKGTILVLQIFCNLLFGLQYLLLNTISGATMNFIAIIRGIIYYHYAKLNKKAPNWVLITLFIAIVFSSLLTSTGIISILPILATLLYTYGIWQDNLKKYRVIIVISAVGWLLYNFSVGAYVSTISSILELVSGFIAIYRYDIKKKKQ